MPHAAATAAALGLMLAASAFGGEIEERYHAGLLNRGLFAVAEGDALRTFSDAAATPTARQAAAVRLAGALAEHSRFVDGDERAALLERAADTLAAAATAFPELPAVRTDLSRGLVAAADAKRRARDALPDLRPAPAALADAENALGVADARLDRVHAALDRRRRDLARGRSRDSEPLTAEELGDLAERAAIGLAEVRVLRAELADRDGERRRLAGDAGEFAAPVRRAGLLSRRAVTLCDSRRLSGDSRWAAEALAAAPQPRTDAVTAADLRLRAISGAADAADRVIALRRAAGGEAAVLGPETEFAAARILAALAREARTAGRADLADQLVARLSRDADRAAAALGGPWAARAGRVAALAARHAGLSPELASQLERAEELAAAGAPGAAAAFAAAADAALAAESADAGIVLPLATRAAAAATTAADRTAAARSLAAALARFPAADGAAAAHFALCSLLGQAYAAAPTADTQRALADALVAHRLRFPDSPTVAAATWRLARHEEGRDQRSAALPLFRVLLGDPARGPAAAAALARCHAGILDYLAERERLADRSGDATTALARHLQLADRQAAARAELRPLAEAPDRPDAAPADRTAGAELRLRTARLLTDGGPAGPADVAAADGLLGRLREAAAANGARAEHGVLEGRGAGGGVAGGGDGRRGRPVRGRRGPRRTPAGRPGGAGGGVRRVGPVRPRRPLLLPPSARRGGCSRRPGWNWRTGCSNCPCRPTGGGPNGCAGPRPCWRPASRATRRRTSWTSWRTATTRPRRRWRRGPWRRAGRRNWPPPRPTPGAGPRRSKPRGRRAGWRPAPAASPACTRPARPTRRPGCCPSPGCCTPS